MYTFLLYLYWDTLTSRFHPHLSTLKSYLALPFAILTWIPPHLRPFLRLHAPGYLLPGGPYDLKNVLERAKKRKVQGIEVFKQSVRDTEWGLRTGWGKGWEGVGERVAWKVLMPRGGIGEVIGLVGGDGAMVLRETEGEKTTGRVRRRTKLLTWRERDVSSIRVLGDEKEGRLSEYEFDDASDDEMDTDSPTVDANRRASARTSQSSYSSLSSTFIDNDGVTGQDKDKDKDEDDRDASGTDYDASSDGTPSDLIGNSPSSSPSTSSGSSPISPLPSPWPSCPPQTNNSSSTYPRYSHTLFHHPKPKFPAPDSSSSHSLKLPRKVWSDRLQKEVMDFEDTYLRRSYRRRVDPVGRFK